MNRENGKGMNETILGWFKRMHPEELWAVKEMPLTVTFKDMEKSMAAGQGMGEPEYHSDTATREMMLNRLAELLDKNTDDLIDWSNAKFMERIRREYKATKSPKKRKPDCGRIQELAESVRQKIAEYATSIVGVDCLMLADALGMDGLASLKSSLCWINSQLAKVDATLGEAREFV